jgi:hypothetical protein
LRVERPQYAVLIVANFRDFAASSDGRVLLRGTRSTARCLTRWVLQHQMFSAMLAGTLETF